MGVKKRKGMKAWRGSGWRVVENADWIRVGDARGRKTSIASSSRRAGTFRFVASFDGTKMVEHGRGRVRNGVAAGNSNAKRRKKACYRALRFGGGGGAPRGLRRGVGAGPLD